MKKNKFLDLYLLDWRFWYKLLSTILICAVLIEALVSTCTTSMYEISVINGHEHYFSWISFKGNNSKIINEGLVPFNGNWEATNGTDTAVISGYIVTIDFIKNHKDLFKFDYIGALLYWCSYFTNQSNILVFSWFLLMTIFHEKEGRNKFTSTYFSIGTATFITITSLIYNFMLMPQMLSSGTKMSAEGWWQNEILHTVGPILCVIYAIMFSRKSNLLSTKDFWKKVNWIYILYPISYGIVIFIVGEVRFASGYSNEMLYPYFFLNIRSMEPIPGVPIPGFLWFIIAVVIIAGICLGFGALYNFGSQRSKMWKTNISWDEKISTYIKK